MFNIEFKYIEVLLLIVLLLPILFIVLKRKNGDINTIFSKRVLEKISVEKSGLNNKTRDIFIIISLIFLIIALARPYIKGKPIKVESSFISGVVGFDLSQSMFVKDIYPNRFELAKRKFEQFLNNFKNGQLGIIGFSSKSFLISPMTNDYNSLKFLISNLSFDYISLKGTSILSALESVNMLYENNKKKQKVAIFFTDGGDKNDLSKEIAYAKENNISVFIYAVATKKGGVIETQNGVVKDKKGDIVISRINENIKKLALQTGGAYLPYSLDKNDIKLLSDSIKMKFKANNKTHEIIYDNKELFYIPLSLALLFYFISIFSLPQRRIKK